MRHDITYRQPVLVGDTIHVELEAIALKRHPTKPRGTVTMKFEIITQKGEAAVVGEWVVVVAARP